MRENDFRRIALGMREPSIDVPWVSGEYLSTLGVTPLLSVRTLQVRLSGRPEGLHYTGVKNALPTAGHFLAATSFITAYIGGQNRLRAAIIRR